MMRRLSVLIVIPFLLAACTPQPRPAGDTPTPTAPACQPSETQTSANQFPEVQGTMKSEGELWALLFFDQAYAKQDLKIVWRVTGTGLDFHVQAQLDNGTVVLPTWTELHGGSSWHRPGVEWGTGFNLPEPGCWTLTVGLGQTSGEIRLEVLPPQ